MSKKDIEILIENQFLSTKKFTTEDLGDIDLIMHEYYQEYTDGHPDIPAVEVVQRLFYGICIRYQPENLRKELLEEFMLSNLAKLYIKMIEERRDLQKKGRFP